MFSINHTLDAPCGADRHSDETKKLLQDAEDWLDDEAEKYGLNVRRRSNPHESGDYPSFEITGSFDGHDPDEEHGMGDDSGACEDCNKYDKKWDEVNKLEGDYFKRFEDSL